MPDSVDFGTMAADGLLQAIRAFKLGPVLGTAAGMSCGT